MLDYSEMQEGFVLTYKQITDIRYLGVFGIEPKRAEKIRDMLISSKGTASWRAALYDNSTMLYIFILKRQRYPKFGVRLISMTEDIEPTETSIATISWKKDRCFVGTRITYPLQLPSVANFIHNLPIHTLTLNVENIIDEITDALGYPITQVTPDTIGFFLSNPFNRSGRLEVYKSEAVRISISSLQYSPDITSKVAFRRNKIRVRLSSIIRDQNDLPWLWLFVESPQLIPDTDVSMPIVEKDMKEEVIDITQVLAENLD